MNNPMQPIVYDKSSDRMRFKANAIVRHLLDWAQDHDYGLNELARMPFSDDDRQQFAQLIGYSLGGYAELSYVSDESCEAAEKMAQQTIRHVNNHERS